MSSVITDMINRWTGQLLFIFSVLIRSKKKKKIFFKFYNYAT